MIRKNRELISRINNVLRRYNKNAKELKCKNIKIDLEANRVYIDDILYVKRDSIDRKCIIKTTYNEIIINKNLSEIMDMLDSRFYLSHRSCLINTDKIRTVDWKNNIIYFENNDTTDYLSRDKRKGLKEYVGNH